MVMSRRLLAAIALALPSAPLARLAPVRADVVPTIEWVEVDAVSMCGLLARGLRSHPVRDLVTVTASTAVEKKSDSFEVFVTHAENAAPRIDIVLGPLRVWADGAEVCAVHARHPSSAFRAEIAESGTLAAIDAHLPPIPMPQVWLALSDTKRHCPPMGPYLGDVEWSRAELAPEAVPPRLRLFGAAQDSAAAVELHAIIEPVVRIERITIRDEAASSTIDIRIEPMGENAAPPAPVSLDGRRTVATVAELVEEPPAEGKSNEAKPECRDAGAA
jgi:hypothetical protein